MSRSIQLGARERAVTHGEPRVDVPCEYALPALGAQPAARATLRCLIASTRLIVGRRIRQPKAHVGWTLRFADDSRARVYRETVVPESHAAAPAVLVVRFRLRWVRGLAHSLFRAESLLNTVLFVGYPGFVSKLWLAHDEHDRYRGIYEWDDPGQAHDYARSLRWVLTPFTVRGSVSYVVIPGRRPAELMSDPPPAPPGVGEWWRVVGSEP